MPVSHLLAYSAIELYGILQQQVEHMNLSVPVVPQVCSYLPLVHRHLVKLPPKVQPKEKPQGKKYTTNHT